MNCCWHQLVRFYWWGGTFEGAVFTVGLGAVAGLIIGAILLAIESVRSFGRGWHQGLAEIRARRLAKQGLPPGDSHPAPPTSDI